jgi:hypothetical protein
MKSFLILLLSASLALAENWTNYPFVLEPSGLDTFLIGTTTTNQQISADNLFTWVKTNMLSQTGAGIWTTNAETGNISAQGGTVTIQTNGVMIADGSGLTNISTFFFQTPYQSVRVTYVEEIPPYCFMVGAYYWNNALQVYTNENFEASTNAYYDAANWHIINPDLLLWTLGMDPIGTNWYDFNNGDCWTGLKMDWVPWQESGIANIGPISGAFFGDGSGLTNISGAGIWTTNSGSGTISYGGFTIQEADGVVTAGNWNGTQVPSAASADSAGYASGLWAGGSQEILLYGYGASGDGDLRAVSPATATFYGTPSENVLDVANWKLTGSGDFSARSLTLLSTNIFMSGALSNYNGLYLSNDTSSFVLETNAFVTLYYDNGWFLNDNEADPSHIYHAETLIGEWIPAEDYSEYPNGTTTRPELVTCDQAGLVKARNFATVGVKWVDCPGNLISGSVGAKTLIPVQHMGDGTYAYVFTRISGGVNYGTEHMPFNCEAPHIIADTNATTPIESLWVEPHFHGRPYSAPVAPDTNVSFTIVWKGVNPGSLPSPCWTNTVTYGLTAGSQAEMLIEFGHMSYTNFHPSIAAIWPCAISVANPGSNDYMSQSGAGFVVRMPSIHVPVGNRNAIGSTDDASP